MSQTVISVEHLSKSYRLGQIGTGTLTNDLKVWFARKMGKPNPLLKIGQEDHGNREGETLWALNDVSFTVEQGEVLGIIGRNGAGKSTLLKILSRVTAPTSGCIKVKGRIASLLEVGTGFHPELTGRENIYLNGAILGMTRQEIARKFDEIVDFAEIEKFIDTPVKRYSSGMYVRLAFAVAAHLESEILLVDEVLAVGDAEFQKKCLGKMGDVASIEGRTVLFVSHNMGAIRNICSKTILINKGTIQYLGETTDVIDHYLLHNNLQPGEVVFQNGMTYKNNEKFKLLSLRLRNESYEVASEFNIERPILVELQYSLSKQIPPMRVAFVLSNERGDEVFTSADSANLEWRDRQRTPGSYKSTCKIPGNLLQPGSYSIRVSADIPFTETLFLSENLVSFHVAQIGGVSGRYAEKWPGIICPDLEWQIVDGN